MLDISVILPFTTSEDKFTAFCSSIFSQGVKVELFVCKCDADFNKNNFKFNNIYFISGGIDEAVKNANGKYILISDENAVYSGDAFKFMLENSSGSACACNVSTFDGNAFVENFTLDELATQNVFCNHLLRKEIIKSFSLSVLSESSYGIMSFIADYYRYDTFVPIHSTLVNLNEIGEKKLTKTDVENLPQYAEIFSMCDNFSAVLFYIRNAFTFLYNEKDILIFKFILSYFKNHSAVNAWIKASYGFDIDGFISDKSNIIGSKNIYYKEVQLPMLPDKMVEEFRMGKQGSATLKKCIVGYIDYNIEIKKGNAVIQYVYKILRKLLGGGSNG